MVLYVATASLAKTIEKKILSHKRDYHVWFFKTKAWALE